MYPLYLKLLQFNSIIQMHSVNNIKIFKMQFKGYIRYKQGMFPYNSCQIYWIKTDSGFQVCPLIAK